MPQRSIVKDILSKDYEPMKNWARRNQTTGNHQTLIQNVREILNLISGGNIIGMLRNILTKREKRRLLSQYVSALENQSTLYNNENQKERHQYLKALKDAELTLKEVQRLGYNATHYAWMECDNDEDRNKGGRKPLSEEKKKQIETHMESKSVPSSNRFLKKINKSARHCQVTYRHAYDTFPHKNDIPYSTFHKYIGDEFKKPYRLTDLCEYCEIGMTLFKEIKAVAIQYGNELFNNDNENINYDELRIYFENLKNNNENEDLDKIIQKIDDLKEVEFHKSIAKRQRESYNRMRTDKELLKNSLLIELDYKQSIVIGEGPRQLNAEFYDRQNKYRSIKSLLGFGIYYVDVDDQIKCLNMDVVSHVNDQDCYQIINTFRFVRQQGIFQNIDKDRYIIWTDCGSTFRCYEFAYFLFNELAEQNIKVTWNVFGDKHGKNARDQHFSAISHYLKSESMLRRLLSTKDVVDTIRKHQTIANKFREKHPQKEPMKFWVGELELPVEQIRRQNKRIITDIRCYYHLENLEIENELKLVSKIFSDRVCDPILVESTYDDNRLANANEPEQILEDELTDAEKRIETLRRKHVKIDVIMRDGAGVVQETAATNIPRPRFCSQNCSTCISPRMYRLDELNYIDQKKLQAELSNHHHPKCRLMPNGKQRLTDEARQELANHYNYAH